MGYSKKEVEEILKNYDNLQRQNYLNELDLKDKNHEIISLKIENDFYKNNKELHKINKENRSLENQLKNKDYDLDYYKSGFKTLCKALDTLLKRPPMPFVGDYISLAQDVAHTKSFQNAEEEAWEEFTKMNENKSSDLGI